MKLFAHLVRMGPRSLFACCVSIAHRHAWGYGDTAKAAFRNAFGFARDRVREEEKAADMAFDSSPGELR